jgi:hypothetical protein
MEQIATQLGVSKMQISRDLDGLRERSGTIVPALQNSLYYPPRDRRRLIEEAQRPMTDRAKSARHKSTSATQTEAACAASDLWNLVSQWLARGFPS